jgi:hypothetical protein
MKTKELRRLDPNVKYADSNVLGEKMISILLTRQPVETGKVLSVAELPLSMFESITI